MNLTLTYLHLADPPIPGILANAVQFIKVRIIRRHDEHLLFPASGTAL